MNGASIVLALLLAGFFLLVGVSKVVAVGSMRERATHAGFSVSARRKIGGLEIAAALGLLIGIAWWPVGAAAGTGLVLLMIGAVVVHRRTGDAVRQFGPAAITALIAIGYLTTVWGGL
ncbi:DoxX family protein [Nocardia sp. NBC_00508]|uniref:DoxX family protein n=1 Tax=Nocardia sp. NBC_00508 TaxID=2975992 RepID=UPI002E806381|nr:DoxX family protein [Nocardia sp. NBC_00508]WUD69430.1 DoxX family protein [Nocardia sp. NBC_00508]